MDPKHLQHLTYVGCVLVYVGCVLVYVGCVCTCNILGIREKGEKECVYYRLFPITLFHPVYPPLHYNGIFACMLTSNTVPTLW
jgi:hypothetical protein